MASIEYAIDRNGNKLYATQAYGGMTYTCPYCLDDVIVRKGMERLAYFAHSPIHDRTPLQRICPGYKGNEHYSYINNSLDKMYINNGGIPLYLCGENERYELRAYFPTLSDISMSKLRDVNAKIFVNTSAIYDADKAEYSIDNLNYYKVDTIESWVKIICKPTVYLPEMHRKWLWGIRGIDIKNDIYHSNKDGGYRVTLKSNINVGKTYRIIFGNHAPNIVGIEFSRLGCIKLKHSYSKTETPFYVYLMKLNLYTEDVRRFIESKGYKLLDSANELIPVWPPAVFEGTELKYEQSKALFLHINKTSKESVYYASLSSLVTVGNNIKSSIIEVLTNNKTLAVANLDENIIEEIKFNIVQVNSLVKTPPIALTTSVMDIDDNTFEFTKTHLKPPRDGKLFVNSNMPFTAIVSNGNYVISSSNVCFEKVRYFDELHINSMAFGVLKYKYKRVDDTTKQTILNFEKVYLDLYRCVSPTVNADTSVIELLYMLSKNINDRNIMLYRLIELWVKTNKIPISAIKNLEKIRISLGGLADERSN